MSMGTPFAMSFWKLFLPNAVVGFRIVEHGDDSSSRWFRRRSAPGEAVAQLLCDPQELVDGTLLSRADYPLQEFRDTGGQANGSVPSQLATGFPGFQNCNDNGVILRE